MAGFPWSVIPDELLPLLAIESHEDLTVQSASRASSFCSLFKFSECGLKRLSRSSYLCTIGPALGPAASWKNQRRPWMRINTSWLYSSLPGLDYGLDHKAVYWKVSKCGRKDRANGPV